MAGHSKWANIQHRKGRQDEKRGKLWTRAIREIMVAARTGGGDLGANPRLRLAVEKAKAVNLPADTVKVDRSFLAGLDDPVDEADRAIVASLIQTAKLNGVGPFAYLRDVLEHIVSGKTKANELSSLLPWAWKASPARAHVNI